MPPSEMPSTPLPKLFLSQTILGEPEKPFAHLGLPTLTDSNLPTGPSQSHGCAARAGPPWSLQLSFKPRRGDLRVPVERHQVEG